MIHVPHHRSRTGPKTAQEINDSGDVDWNCRRRVKKLSQYNETGSQNTVRARPS